jgi:TRAP-type C4-dicarboxylate transport system permease small subunit
MKKIFKIYNEVLNYIAVLGLVGFLFCVALQVFARVFLPTSPNWTEELARFLFIYMVAFAGNTAVAKDEYVGVELLVERFPAVVQKAIKILVLTAILIFSAIIFFTSVMGPKGLLAITPVGMVSTALRLPMRKVYLSMAILFGLYIVSYIMNIICVIKGIDIYEKGKTEEIK